MTIHGGRGSPFAPLIRVGIADDSGRQREGWALTLGTQPDIQVVGHAGDGGQALALARRTPVDVLLLDIQMPRVGGYEAARRIREDAKVREHGPVPRIIMFATVDIDAALPEAAEAGAYAVLYKDVRPEALFDVVREAAAFAEA